MQLESSDQAPCSLGGGTALAQMAHRRVSILRSFKSWLGKAWAPCQRAGESPASSGRLEERSPGCHPSQYFCDSLIFEPMSHATVLQTLNAPEISLPYLKVTFTQVFCLLVYSLQYRRCTANGSFCLSPGLCAFK